MTAETNALNPAETSPTSLIFCSAGKRISDLPWLKELTGFDVALVYYGDEPITPPKTKYFLTNKDFKIPNFIQLAREHPDVLSYDYFFFVDDDLIFEPDVFQRWLNVVKANQLDVSQPALSGNSAGDWPHTKQQNHLTIDFDQFVEVGCFCLSKRALRFALPFFFMAKTGAGLDIAIYLLRKRHQLRSAVIHELSVYHPLREQQQTVRKQYSEFASFNPQLSKFIAFCFDEKDTQTNLALASVNLGNTSPHVVRLISSFRFIRDRIIRKIKSTYGGAHRKNPTQISNNAPWQRPRDD